MSNIILTFMVKLCLITYVLSDGTSDGDDPIIFQSLIPDENFTIDEFKTLHLNIYGLEKVVQTQVPCGGRCTVNNNIILPLTCDMAWGVGQKLCFNITIENNITKEYNGQWLCEFGLNTTGIPTYQNSTLAKSFFRLNVVPLPTTTTADVIPTAASASQGIIPGLNPKLDIYIISGIGTLMLLIILGQIVYIIYLRRKLKTLRPEAVWSKKVEKDPEDQARYSKTPCQRVKEEASIPADARESGIYEVLEHLRAPEQPPVSTIPKSKSTSASEKPVSTPTTTRSLTNGMSLPWKKKKKKESLIDTEAVSGNKRSTIERMKERPRVPTPEEVYQALESDDNITPPAPRRQIPPTGAKKKDAKPKPVKKKEEFRKEVPAKEVNAPVTAQEFCQPRPKPPVLVPSVTTKPKSGPVPADLKNALELRMRLNTAMQKSDQPPPNSLPKIQPPPPLQIQRFQESPKPKYKAWPKEPPKPQQQPTPSMPRAKQWPHEEVTASLPRKGWPQEETPPNPQRGKPWLASEVPPGASRTKPWTQDVNTPKSRRKPWPQEPIPSEKSWDQEPSSPQDRTWPQGPNPSQHPERIGAVPSKVLPLNPGLPPPDAPPARVRRPPPPVKPKQLHPLPQPPSESAPPVIPKQLHPLHQPLSEPDPIPDYLDSANEASDDDEEWNYEPLPHYNIYSM